MLITASNGFQLCGLQEVKLGPCIIPDEPVGKHVLEQVVVIKDPDGYTFEVRNVCRRGGGSVVAMLMLFGSLASLFQVLYRTLRVLCVAFTAMRSSLQNRQGAWLKLSLQLLSRLHAHARPIRSFA